MNDQITIGFSFESDWLRRWHKFSGPITDWAKSGTVEVLMDYLQNSVETDLNNNPLETHEKYCVTFFLMGC